MGFYLNTPFKPLPQLMTLGSLSYLFGSFNDKTGPTTGNVISNSSVTTTATLTFNLLSGNVPVPGSLVSVTGTANSAGVFNVIFGTVLTVVMTAANGIQTGVCTITYAIASTTQATLPDGGQVVIAQPEIGDLLTSALITSGAYSQPAAPPLAPPSGGGRSLSVTVSLPANTAAFPSTLAGVTVNLQGANIDLNSEYTTIATVASAVAAGSVTNWQSGQMAEPSPGAVNLPNYRFYRLQVATGATGTGYIVGSILQ